MKSTPCLILAICFLTFLSCENRHQKKPKNREPESVHRNIVYELFNTDVDSALSYLTNTEEIAISQKDTVKWLEVKSTFIGHYFNQRNIQALDSFILVTKHQKNIFGKTVKKVTVDFGEAQKALLEGKYDSVLKRIDNIESSLGTFNSAKFNFRLFHLKGNMLRLKNNLDDALTAYLKAKEILTKNDFGEVAKSALNYSIAGIYHTVEEYDKVIITLEQAYSDFQNQPFFRFHANLNLAESYIELKDFSCAKHYIKFLEQDEHLRFNLNNRASYEMLLGLYNYQQALYKKSVDHYTNAYKIFQENENANVYETPFLTNYLSYSYFELKEFELAKKYAKITTETAKELNNNYQLIAAYNLLGKVDSAKGNYKSALQYHKKAARLNDTMLSNNNKEKLANLELKISEEKKDNEIANLKLQNSEQKLAAIKNKQSRIIIGFLLLLVLVFSCILYYRYQTKKKTNKLLQEKEAILNRMLNEKELLLKEIHHRVKNNLQLIMSLLAIQGLSQEKENRVIKAFLEKGESRIQSMALIHQILYETEGVQYVNFKHYLQELLEAIKKSYPSNTSQIVCTLNVSDIHFNLEQALSLGLITNEVVMNAIKHAFPKEKKDGAIEISLNKTENIVVLSVKDNGIGISSKKNRRGAIGMELVALLAEQLRGKIRISKDNGTHFSIALSVE